MSPGKTSQRGVLNVDSFQIYLGKVAGLRSLLAHGDRSRNSRCVGTSARAIKVYDVDGYSNGNLLIPPLLEYRVYFNSWRMPLPPPYQFRIILIRPEGAKTRINYDGLCDNIRWLLHEADIAECLNGVMWTNNWWHLVQLITPLLRFGSLLCTCGVFLSQCAVVRIRFAFRKLPHCMPLILYTCRPRRQIRDCMLLLITGWNVFPRFQFPAAGSYIISQSFAYWGRQEPAALTEDTTSYGTFCHRLFHAACKQ